MLLITCRGAANLHEFTLHNKEQLNFNFSLDLHRLVLHAGLPAPCCFDCNSAQSGKKLLVIFLLFDLKNT